MSDAALIELPDGSPGAVAEAGTSLQRVAGGFERGGGVVARASSTVSGWEGRASISFDGRAASYGLAMVAVDQALTAARAAVKRYEAALEDARAKIRQLREQEDMAAARLERAKQQLEEAKGRLAGAQQRMSAASFSAGMSEPFSMAESAQAGRDADDAQGDIDAAQKQIDREREEIRELREDAKREREQLVEAEQDAASTVRAAAGRLPDVQLPNGAASPSAYAGTIFAGPVSPFARDPRWASSMAKAAAEEPEDDRAWYEKAPGWLGDQAVGVAKGFGEGVVGIGEGGLMLYRMSPTNALLDRDSFDRQWADTGRAAEFAWQNPGEFGKAVVNWEDLAAGRYGEWVGGFGPDAVLAVGTAGVGTAATRGLRTADALGDTADAARDADRVGDAARASDRVEAGGPSAARAEHLDELKRQAGAAGVPVPEAGMRVERTYGEIPTGLGDQRGSQPFGTSWTPERIDSMSNPRDDLGLPEFNGGRYRIIATLDDPASVAEIRRALPWDGPDGYFARGGGAEYLIPDAHLHVTPERVEGVNPDF